jgi:hypothetical protein
MKGYPVDRPFEELSDSGLLWLINRVVFHPRGFALAITVTDDGEATGWSLMGDGSEQWRYGDDEDDKFRRAEATLNAQRRPSALPACRDVGAIELSEAPGGQYVIGRADQSVDMTMVLLKQLLGTCASNRDGLVVFSGVDPVGNPREVAYREIGFNPTSNPDANEGGYLMLERVSE